MYAVTTGTYVGELFAFVEKADTNLRFLSLPKMLIREIPEENFEFAMKNNIMEFVEQLPRDVYQVVEAQFKQVLKAS
jgi:predicted nuclease of restriction endonuclease-like (RecB) superfamily